MLLFFYNQRRSIGIVTRKKVSIIGLEQGSAQGQFEIVDRGHHSELRYPGYEKSEKVDFLQFLRRSSSKEIL